MQVPLNVSLRDRRDLPLEARQFCRGRAALAKVFLASSQVGRCCSCVQRIIPQVRGTDYGLRGMRPCVKVSLPYVLGHTQIVVTENASDIFLTVPTL